MSLFNTLNTSVSGMAAQANSLSVIGDNIANVSTTGYKEAQAQFETVLGAAGGGEYESGGVKTDIRYGVTNPGTPLTTASPTDLAINGNGFFLVSKPGDDGQYLTRAGSFVADSNGNLVNSAGYNLMANKIGPDGLPEAQPSVVNVAAAAGPATASTTGTLTLNLNSASAVVSGDTPASNASDATYTEKTSVTAFDNLGGAQVYDVYLTKISNTTTTGTAPNTTTTNNPQWQVTAYPQSDATNGGFPYTNASNVTNSNTTGADTPNTTTLSFDETTGKVASGGPLTIAVANGAPGGVKIDLSKTTQLTSDFAIESQTMNGNKSSALTSVSVAADGTINAVYASGTTAAIYKIPLGNVESPDNLTPINGNVYQVSSTSGLLNTSSAGSNGVGTIDANALEQSNVDLATELTNMISAQRAYEANSKVLQAASTLLGDLNQIQTN